MASPTSPASQLPHHPGPRRSGIRSARYLHDLSSTLLLRWHTMDDVSRHAIIHEVLQIAEEIQETPREAHHPVLTAAPRDAFSFLTPRELQVLEALAEGTSTVEMADQFEISEMTVRGYVKSILSKLGVHSRLGAVTMFLNRDHRSVIR